MDFYDPFFDREGEIFERLSIDGLNRIDMFIFLKSLEFKTPNVGIVKNITLNSNQDVVVYTNVNSHCGEGKEKLSYIEAIKKYPNYFCSEYIAPEEPNTSIRHLQIGNRSWLILYKSYGDWRSNVGDGEIKILHENKVGYHSQIKCPLYAIDFILSSKYDLYAIDFNIAPGIRGTGIEKILRGSEVVSLIKNTYHREENL